MGWRNDAYMRIDGHRYCDNFVSYKSFQKIVVNGNTVGNICIKTLYLFPIKFFIIYYYINSI